jgi:uncharacterized membrane protein
MRKWYPAVAVALIAIISLLAYPKLPDTIPMHWDARGRVNGYGSKTFVLVLMPLLALGIWGLMRVIPRLDPRRQNYEKMWGAYELVINATITILLLVHVIVIAKVLGAPITIERVVPALVGAMLIIVGNVLPQARPNWFFGIRTPWTLSNDRVWERTQRVGGYLLVMAGVAGLLSAALPRSVGFPVFFGATTIAVIGAVAYSFVAWKQETSSTQEQR